LALLYGDIVLNGLPSDVTSAPSLAVFRRRLKTELFRRCYNAAWLVTYFPLIVVLEMNFLFRPL